jgi:kinesin family member 6/9
LQTVNALARKESHVPYRQCRLTSVLKDALGGNSLTVMIANVWTEEAHVEETISTLRFAERMRMLTTTVKQSESDEPSLLLRRYERQIRELKQVRSCLVYSSSAFEHLFALRAVSEPASGPVRSKLVALTS